MSSTVHFSKESGGGFTKKKLFGLLFAICILVGLLTATALAEDVTYSDTAYFKFFGSSSYVYEPGNGEVIYLKTNGTTVSKVTSTDPHDIILSYDKATGKATIELKGTNISSTKTHNIEIGSSGNTNFNVDIIVSGNCTISGTNNPIRTYINGEITIKGDDDNTMEDHLSLTTSGGSTRRPIYSSGTVHLIIDGVKFTAKSTGTSGSSAITADSVTIQKSADVTLYTANAYAIEAASGDVLVEDSTLTMSNNSDGTGSYLIYLKTKDTQSITFTNSTVIGANGHSDARIFNEPPVISGGYLFEGSTETLTVNETDGSFDASTLTSILTEYDEDLTGAVTGRYHYFKIMPCACKDKVALGGDCTTGLKCDDCGTEYPEEAYTDHTYPDGTPSCAANVKCTVAGCDVVRTPTEHTIEFEHTDCTTEVKCSACNTIVCEAKATHTYTDDDALCDNLLFNGAPCNHERKQAYVKLVNNELTLTGGQTKYYQTNDVEGERHPVTAGVTPENATIIITYDEGRNTVIVELKDVKLDGITSGGYKTQDTFTFGKDDCKDFNVEIVVGGACTLDASISNNAYIPIRSNITGEFTIKGKNDSGDSLTIIDKSATGNSPSVNIAENLVIENVALTVRNMKGTSVSSSSSAIGAKNITIENSNVNLYSYEEHAINATGDVNVEGSTLTMSSDNSEDPLVNTTGTITIADSTVTAGTGHKNGSIFSEAPALDFSVTDNGYVFEGSTGNPTITAATQATDAAIDKSKLDLEKTYAESSATTYKYFSICPCTHAPETDWENIDHDCTTGLQCPTCGIVLGTVFNATHTDPRNTDSYQPDCEKNVICSVEGCEFVLTQAGTHTPKDDDDDCTTDILCEICNNVAIPGASTHTYNGSTDPDCNIDGCEHKRNLAYVQLLDEKLTLADGDKYYYNVAVKTEDSTNTLEEITSEVEKGNAQIIISYKEDQNNTWGKVTVTLNSANINTYSGSGYYILTLGNGTYFKFDVDIIVSGSCSIGNSTNTKTPIRTTADFEGTVTISGNDNTDNHLTLTRNHNNYAGHSLDLASSNLIIDGVTVTAIQPNSAGGSAITAKNVTIRNSEVKLFSYNRHAINATGNVLVQNSRLTMSNNYTHPLINLSDNDNQTITFENSTVIGANGTESGSMFSKQLELPASCVFAGSVKIPEISTDPAQPDALGNISTNGIEFNPNYDPALTTKAEDNKHYHYFCIAPRTTPTYTITIPATLDASVGGTIGASGITNLSFGDALQISVSGENILENGKVKLALATNHNVLIYSQMNVDGNPVSKNAPIISFTEGGEHTITFGEPEDVQYAGTYTGTITFSVSWYKGGNAA